MPHHDNTYSELACLYSMRPFLGRFFKSITVKLNGIRISVRTAAEADEVLQAYPEILAQLEADA